mmetsp:Transcript_9186/g.27638  ORF Transcript_9186/g.27638 Transcript_9186/m.27638 type:complete len:116 (-) Transcript_9186:1473-1820(-)
MSTMSTSSSAPGNPKYSLQSLRDGRTRATFDVPADLAPRLASVPIVSNGGIFELFIASDDNDDALVAPTDKGTARLCVEFYSPKPERTAGAIAERLAARMDDPSPPGMEETCTVS